MESKKKKRRKGSGGSRKRRQDKDREIAFNVISYANTVQRYAQKKRY